METPFISYFKASFVMSKLLTPVLSLIKVFDTKDCNTESINREGQIHHSHIRGDLIQQNGINEIN